MKTISVHHSNQPSSLLTARRPILSLLLVASVPLGCNKETLLLGDDNPDAGVSPSVSGSGGSSGEGGSSGSGGDVGGGGHGGQALSLGGSGGAPPVPTITDPFGTSGISCTGLNGTLCGGEGCCSSSSLPAGAFSLGRSHASITCEEPPVQGVACDEGGETCYDAESDRVWGCVPQEAGEPEWADLGAVDGDMSLDRGDAGPVYSGVNQPEIVARVSGFALDKYEVTVGRFRRFVSVYDSIEVQTGVGAHPNIPGSGWQEDWNEYRFDRAAVLMDRLKCDVDYQTWTDEGDINDWLPINCVDWFHAFLFCAWDGGRLPTEAEWEYAASGGEENRQYPWGNDQPASDVAVFDWRGNGSQDERFGDIVPVGQRPLGDGRWGHANLAGNMREWTLDGYQRGYDHFEPGCLDCFNDSRSDRIIRGAGFDQVMIRTNERGGGDPIQRSRNLGFRCARAASPPPSPPM